MVTGQVSNLFDNIVFLYHISNISKIVSQWTCNTSPSSYWKSCEWFSTNLTIWSENLSWQKKQIDRSCWIRFCSARNWKQFYWQQPSWLEIGPIDIGKVEYYLKYRLIQKTVLLLTITHRASHKTMLYFQLVDTERDPRYEGGRLDQPALKIRFALFPTWCT